MMTKPKIRSIEFLWDLKEPLPKVRSKNKVTIKVAVPRDKERLRKIVVEAYCPSGRGGLGKLVERKELVLI